MARLQSSARFTYALGWISAAAAFAYHALFYGSIGARILAVTRVSPYQLLELGVLSFIISIASDVRAISSERGYSIGNPSGAAAGTRRS